MDGIRLIDVKEEILSDNKDLANMIRSDLSGQGVFLLNLMGSPGSGKTSLILQTVAQLRDRYRIAVVETDIDSLVDSEKVAAKGIPVVQIRTGGSCHADAAMVEKALQALPLDDLDLIILENVGNLVCPAETDTGAFSNAVLLSVPEGDDKPLKYPLVFTVCDALVINKIDFASLTDFDSGLAAQRARALNPAINVFELSCTTSAGVAGWIEWLDQQLAAPATRNA